MKSISQKENQFASSKLKPAEKSGLTTTNFTVRHAVSHVGAVRAVIDATNGQLDQHRARIEECKALVAQLSDKSANSNEELLQSLKGHFEKIYNNFTVQITLQRQENEKMQQKTDRLKKEKTEIQQTVIGLAQKCAELEQELGRYPI